MGNPKHVAIIMDGNGRWAERKRKPRTFGHSQGVTSLKRIVTVCPDIGVEILTVYAFSTENWQRPKKEVDFLLKLMDKTFVKEIDELHQQGVRIKLLGDSENIGTTQQEIWQAAEEKTRNNTRLLLNVAFNYGGRNEIVNAAKAIAEQVKAGILTTDNISELVFAQNLYTGEIPDPDLIIRTGGEQRLSNFLLWQAAYAEWYFTDVLWPEFDENEFKKALANFHSRNRRFGQI